LENAAGSDGAPMGGSSMGASRMDARAWLLLLVLAANGAADAADCADRALKCVEWAAAGECQRNPT